MTDRKITSENLYLILPGKVSKMAMMYAADFGLPITKALRRIYQSETYRQLEDESTKLWHYGPVALWRFIRYSWSKTNPPYTLLYIWEL